MKLHYNKVSTVVDHFRKELNSLYPKYELENLIFLTFEHYLGFSKTYLLLNKNEKINEPKLKRLYDVVKELKQNKPIQYVLGVAEFFGLKLMVTPDVMIPRPETEELVHWIINDTKSSSINDSERLTILDVGTGSGCIAIALKKNLPKAKVMAIDISKEALSIARKNAKANGVNISFIHEDILTRVRVGLPVVSEAETYDIIVSNPPYVRISEKKLMRKNVLDYEPHTALFVPSNRDENPLLFYDLISALALSKLKKNGKLYFEINEKFGSAIKQLIIRKGFSNIRLRKDIRGKDRMICGQLHKCL